MAKKVRSTTNIPKGESVAESSALPPVPDTESTNTVLAREPLYKKWFFISILAMLCITWISGYNLGLCTDEIDMNQYGKANIDYYKSGGKDTTFLNLLQDGDTSHFMKTLPFYGSDFEYIATGINTITGNVNGKQEYNIRHALNQLFLILAVLFTGLCAARIKNYRAALLASWLLFLTPAFFGWGLIDTKDIPFCTGYIATLYFIIRLLEELPNPSWKTTLWLMLALAFTLGIRIGGLLLIGYFVLFIAVSVLTSAEMRQSVFKKGVLMPLALKVVTVVIGALAITIVLWPFVLINPATNLLEAINSARKFPAVISMNFKGDKIFSNELPPGYLFTSLMNTLPVFIIGASVFSIVFLFVMNKRLKRLPVLLIVLATVLPIVVSLQSGMSLYNGWRHLLFFYPCLMVLTGLGIEAMMDILNKPVAEIGIAVLCLAGMAHPILWSVKNHPYEYTYYNEITGFDKGYYDFENDVWTISVKPALDWLATHEQVTDTRDSITIGSNVSLYVRLYFKTFYPKAKVKVMHAGAADCRDKYFDYLILNTIFLTTGYLREHYPPEGTIHTEDVAGRPVTAVIKDATHLQYRCLQAILAVDFKKADSLLKVYQATTKKFSPFMNGPMAITKAMNQRFDEAVSYANKGIANEPMDFFSHVALTYVYYKQNNLEQAVNQINICLEIAPVDGFVRQLADSIDAKMPRN